MRTATAIALRTATTIAIGVGIALLLGVLFHLFGWNNHNLAVIPLGAGVVAGYFGWKRGAVWFPAKP